MSYYIKIYIGIERYLYQLCKVTLQVQSNPVSRCRNTRCEMGRSEGVWAENCCLQTGQ